MKTIFRFLPVLAILVLSACEKEQSLIPAKGEIQFAISPPSENSGGRLKETATPAAVLLSITDDDGNVIEQNKKLSLYAFGSSFTSEGLQLTVGNYVLTQFVVIDAANEIIYAAPVEGSNKAQFVTDPLPINFSVSESGSTTITPQVLIVNEIDIPENFGYVSFGFEVVTGLYFFEIPLLGTENIDSAFLLLNANGYNSKIEFTLSATKAVAVASGNLGGDAQIEVQVFTPKTGTATWTHLPGLARDAYKYEANVTLNTEGGTVDIPSIYNESTWETYDFNVLSASLIDSPTQSSFPSEIGVFLNKKRWGTFLEAEFNGDFNLTYFYADKISFWTALDGSAHTNEPTQTWSYCNDSNCNFPLNAASKKYFIEYNYESKKGLISYHESFIFATYTNAEGETFQAQNVIDASLLEE
jgi:hypothetical protein